MTKLTRTFEALDTDGKEHTILEWTNLIHAGTMTDPHAVIEGLKTLRTSNGLSVNRLEKGKYQIVQTGVSLHSDSPDAA